jgi:hypothetical protein
VTFEGSSTRTLNATIYDRRLTSGFIYVGAGGPRVRSTQAARVTA